jgi:hypothetical protein
LEGRGNAVVVENVWWQPLRDEEKGFTFKKNSFSLREKIKSKLYSLFSCIEHNSGRW